MITVASSAPGKLVLLGEYAVLFGHPAVVLAIDRRARVDLRPADDRCWSVAAPGFQEEATAFDLDGDRGFLWREPATEAADRLVLVEKVVGSLMAGGLIKSSGLAPASVTLDTREFFHSSETGVAKLGLGSSAALTVALTEAFRCWSRGSGQPPAIDLAQLLDLHCTFQGGRGSGIDLAASTGGGVVEYRLLENGRVPEAGPMDLPQGLHLVFPWTGRSASTGDFLARLDQGMRSDGGGIAVVLEALGRISASGIGHLKTGDLLGLLADVNDFGETMDRLGHSTGIPILSDEHIALRRLARDMGVSYKPSGAGGGDVGIGFTDDPDRAKAFAANAANEGFPPLDLEIDPKGVQTNCQF